jgi:hypothetical protein
MCPWKSAEYCYVSSSLVLSRLVHQRKNSQEFQGPIVQTLFHTIRTLPDSPSYLTLTYLYFPLIEYLTNKTTISDKTTKAKQHGCNHEGLPRAESVSGRR